LAGGRQKTTLPRALSRPSEAAHQTIDSELKRWMARTTLITGCSLPPESGLREKRRPAMMVQAISIAQRAFSNEGNPAVDPNTARQGKAPPIDYFSFVADEKVRRHRGFGGWIRGKA